MRLKPTKIRCKGNWNANSYFTIFDDRESVIGSVRKTLKHKFREICKYSHLHFCVPFQFQGDCGGPMMCYVDGHRQVVGVARAVTADTGIIKRKKYNEWILLFTDVGFYCVIHR